MAATAPSAIWILLSRSTGRIAAGCGRLCSRRDKVCCPYGHTVTVVPGRRDNLKLTTPEDLAMAEGILRRRGEPAHTARIGQGYDVHRLVEGRPLVLGGVRVRFERGLLGHSDADVLSHAVADALLGAIGAGDIGRHFPDTDPAYAGISSLLLLSKVAALVSSAGRRVVNVDATVMAERPKLAPYIPDMARNIAKSLGVSHALVSIKATTTEGLGFVGKGEGIAALAVAMVTSV